MILGKQWIEKKLLNNVADFFFPYSTFPICRLFPHLWNGVEYICFRVENPHAGQSLDQHGRSKWTYNYSHLTRSSFGRIWKILIILWRQKVRLVFVFFLPASSAVSSPGFSPPKSGKLSSSPFTCTRISYLAPITNRKHLHNVLIHYFVNFFLTRRALHLRHPGRNCNSYINYQLLSSKIFKS